MFFFSFLQQKFQKRNQKPSHRLNEIQRKGFTGAEKAVLLESCYISLEKKKRQEEREKIVRSSFTYYESIINSNKGSRFICDEVNWFNLFVVL